MSSRHLKVVVAEPKSEEPEQLSLALGHENAMWVAHIADLAAQEFLHGLHEAKPRWVVDLRPVPDFLKPGLNRGRVFRELDALRASYRDLGGVIGAEGLTNPHIIAEHLQGFWKSCDPPFGPIVLLVGRTLAIAAAAMMLHEVLRSTNTGKWQVRHLGKPVVPCPHLETLAPP